MGAKLNSFFGNLAQFSQAEYLKTTGIGQNGTIPGHKTMQTTELFHQPVSRPQVEVVGIGQDDLSPDFPQITRTHRLYRGVSTHRHKDRCLDQTMCGGQQTTASG